MPGRQNDHRAIAARIGKRPELLPAIVAGLDSDTARVRYGCLKVLRLLSEANPAVLYPEFSRFARLLDSENQILQWGAILILGNLATVDAGRRIDRLLDRYLRPIRGPVMITAANVIGGAAQIALARPDLADRIARAVLRVERAKYQTAECRNVAIGHAVAALDSFYAQLKRPRPVVAFVRRQARNRRGAVRRKVARFLRRHAGE